MDQLRLLLTQVRQAPQRPVRRLRAPPIIHSFRQMRPVRLPQEPVARAQQLRAQGIIHIALPVAHVRRLALAVLVRQHDPVDPAVQVDPEAEVPVAPVVPVAPAEYDLALPHVRALMVRVPEVPVVPAVLLDQVAHVPSRQAEVPDPVMPVAAHPLAAAHPVAHLAEVPEVPVAPVVPVVEVPVAVAPQVLSVSKVASRAKRVRARRYVAKNSTTCLRQNLVASSSLAVMDLPRFEWHAELH
ncbi:MAG: hypothetical protein JW395_2766 [Nitrospira sp.]|nr:hypothetical protein [Nitrospira sp.]